MSHRFLVLGLLSERPMTGYDIKKHVNGSLSAVTNASYGTLYPTLHKLLTEGAVAVQEVPQKGRPSKKVYRITERGQRELEKWLIEPASADQVRREFLLKLYLAKDLSTHHVLNLIACRREEITRTLQTLRAEKDGVSNPYQAWVLDYSLALCEAEIDWLRQLEHRIGAA